MTDVGGGPIKRLRDVARSGVYVNWVMVGVEEDGHITLVPDEEITDTQAVYLLTKGIHILMSPAYGVEDAS